MSQPVSLHEIEKLLAAGNGEAALQAARVLVEGDPQRMEAHVLLGHALRQRGDTDSALDAARRAAELQPLHPAPEMLEADLRQDRGERDVCIDIWRRLADDQRQPSARLLQDIAQRFTMLGLHVDAEHCHARALQQERDNPQYIYNHATSLIALGQLEQAEAALDRVVALRPDDSDAWYNRATLRKQTAEANHVEAIKAHLRQLAPSSPGVVALGYALAKEREDLGEHPQAFAALKQAADARRALLRYRVEDDVDTMKRIAAAFDDGFFARAHQGHDDARPVFIVGLPRSGTTLVDRILSSHPAISSRGETSDLVMALVHAAGKVSGKAELVQRSTQLDFNALGRRYCANLDATLSRRQIDKTPINFLYLGIIAAALPHARIIHLRRNPMDACYAMYKTLFRMAYPFSYDLGDLAAYWIAYDHLMAHWSRCMPAGQLMDVDYEDLVTNQETVSRRLVAFVGQPWDSACLAFERNSEPSLTASAAQVRQPIYRSSVQLWRRYEKELAPLRAALESTGVDIDRASTALGDATTQGISP